MWVYVGASCGSSSDEAPQCTATKLVCDQCVYVFAAVSACEATLTCPIASEESFVGACAATPLTQQQFEAFQTWSCGDVKAVYCGDVSTPGWPTWLDR